MKSILVRYWAPVGNAWTETNYQQDAKAWMEPMTAYRPSKVVEIPANWHLDDWPPLQPNMGVPGSVGISAVMKWVVLLITRE